MQLDGLTADKAVLLTMQDKEELIMAIVGRKAEIVREMRPLRFGYHRCKHANAMMRSLPSRSPMRDEYRETIVAWTDAADHYEELVAELKILTSLQSGTQTVLNSEKAAAR